MGVFIAQLFFSYFWTHVNTWFFSRQGKNIFFQPQILPKQMKNKLKRVYCWLLTNNHAARGVFRDLLLFKLTPFYLCNVHEFHSLGLGGRSNHCVRLNISNGWELCQILTAGGLYYTTTPAAPAVTHPYSPHIRRIHIDEMVKVVVPKNLFNSLQR